MSRTYIDQDELTDHLRRIIESCATSTAYNEGFVDGLEFVIAFAAGLRSVQYDEADET